VYGHCVFVEIMWLKLLRAFPALKFVSLFIALNADVYNDYNSVSVFFLFTYVLASLRGAHVERVYTGTVDRSCSSTTFKFSLQNLPRADEIQ